MGLDHDFCAAALPDLQIKIGRFSDHDDVGVDALCHLACSNTLKALLVDDAGNIDLTCKVARGIGTKESRSAHHRSQSALHIGRSSSVHTPVHDLCRKRIMRPYGGIGHGNGVHMAVEKNLGPRAISTQHADNVSVSIPRHLVESGIFHDVFEIGCDVFFFARIASTLYKTLNARDDDIFTILT